MGVADVQSKLGANEVLLFFADTGKLGTSAAETFVWAVPKAGPMRWVRIGRSTGELRAAVRALRNAMGVGADDARPKCRSAAGRNGRHKPGADGGA